MNQESLCPICLCSFVNQSMCPCGHVFCEDCLCQALKWKPQCPLCRRPYCEPIGESIRTFVKQSFNKQLPWQQLLQENSFNVFPLFLINQLENVEEHSFYSDEQNLIQFNIFFSDIQLINMAMKSNLLIVTQNALQEMLKVCDIYKISKIFQEQSQGKQYYRCKLEHIDRAKLKRHLTLQNLTICRPNILKDTHNLSSSQNIISDLKELIRVRGEIFDILTDQQKQAFNQQLIDTFELEQYLEETNLKVAQLSKISEISLRMTKKMELNLFEYNKYFYSTKLVERIQMLTKKLKQIKEIVQNN